MTDNRSLDEFASGAGEGPPDDEGATGDGAGADGEGSPNGADPIVSTYSWSPEGAACADCGAVAERRWRDGDDLVCADCKSW